MEGKQEIDAQWLLHQLRLTGGNGLHFESLVALVDRYAPDTKYCATAVRRNLTLLRRAGRVQLHGSRWTLTASEYLRGSVA